MKKIVFFFLMTILIASCHQEELSSVPVSYTHLTLPTNREV